MNEISFILLERAGDFLRLFDFHESRLRLYVQGVRNAKTVAYRGNKGVMLNLDCWHFLNSVQHPISSVQDRFLNLYYLRI